VIISGGGRCNVTTSISDKKILATKYTRGWDFIKKAIGKFSPKKTFDWFEAHGVPLQIQDDLRVFPRSDDGRDVVGVFEDIIAKNSDIVTVHYSDGVTAVGREGDRFHIQSKNTSLEADILVITTGGNAYAHTGSTGDGYVFARSLGHSITRL